jgi:hypothetical protein
LARVLALDLTGAKTDASPFMALLPTALGPGLGACWESLTSNVSNPLRLRNVRYDEHHHA